MAIKVAELEEDQTMFPSPRVSGKAEKKVSTPKPSRKRTMPTGIESARRPRSPTET